MLIKATLQTELIKKEKKRERREETKEKRLSFFFRLFSSLSFLFFLNNSLERGFDKHSNRFQ